MQPNKTIIEGNCNILVESLGNWKRLGKIFFLKDNSVCFAFPKMVRGGILAASECSRTTAEIQKIDLTNQGKVTRETVKFTYHGDGNAHFSMDGKIHTKIGITSHPFTNEERHLFSCQYVNILGADNLSEAKYERYAKDGCLRIHFTDGSLPALNVSAHLFPINRLDINEYNKSNHVIIISNDHRVALKVFATPCTFNVASADQKEINETTPMFFFCGGFTIETNVTMSVRGQSILPYKINKMLSILTI